MARRKSIRTKPLWQRLLEGLTALIATVNLGLVFFDLTYIHSRYFWLTGKIVLPLFSEVTVPFVSVMGQPLTQLYDPVKGIDQNPDTQRYLDLLDELDQHQRALKSPAAKAIVANLKDLSIQMINEDPFQLAGKTGTLEKIQNRVRGYVQSRSSKEAFEQFWNSDYLIAQHQADEPDALEWFEESVRPLIERSNYVRKIDNSGEFVDHFGLIDFEFRVWFFFELLIRIVLIQRRYPSLSLREALFRRWYDYFLVLPLPPVMLWIRIFPVVVRLREAGVNLEPIRSQISRGFVAIFASELTEVIALQTIKQLQTSISRGEITNWLLQTSQREYIDLNNTNEIEVISRRLAQLLVYQVLPYIQPDVEALLNHNVKTLLNESALYKTLHQLPGIGLLPEQIFQQLMAGVSQLITKASQGAYDRLTADDPIALELIDRLAQHFREAFTNALQDQQTLQELQSLLTDLLEEVKVNYVRRLSEEDFEQLLEEAEQLVANKIRK
jgi:hypothetical protein